MIFMRSVYDFSLSHTVWTKYPGTFMESILKFKRCIYRL